MNPNESEWQWRQAQWERLLNILDEANDIQQRLLGDDDQEACYEFHTQLSNLSDAFEDFAAADEKHWTGEEENG